MSLLKKNKKNHQICIVGGGLAGLYLADLLSEHDENWTIHLFEKNANFGGRVKTVYEKKKDVVKYESGPWRIHSSHERIVKLIKKMKLTLVPLEQKKSFFGFSTCNNNKKSIQFSLLDTNEITQYQHEILTTKNGVSAVNEKMMQTGYDNIYQQAHGTNAYQIHTNKGQSKESVFYVIQEGFSSIIEHLENSLKKKKNVKLHLNSKITNIGQKSALDFQLNVQERVVEENNSFVHYQKSASMIVCAVPPSDMSQWDISKQTILPNIQCIDSLPLMHIMAESDASILKKSFKYIVHSPICQIISSCFQNDWFQISYSSGRFAMLWENLRLKNKKIFETNLTRYFYELFPKSVKLNKIIPHFWRHAVHYWLPNRNMKPKHLMKHCLQPNISKCKNFYWIGESISTYQGWMEGALETSEIVFLKIVHELSNKKSQEKKELPKEYVIYDGRILNVKEWKHVHPGSKEAIENHLFQDITELWDQYHPKEASKYFIGLQS